MAEQEETETTDEAAKPKRSPLKRILGILLPALMFGGGGFYATYSGAINLPIGPGAGGGDSHHAEETSKKKDPAAFDVAYLPLEELVVPLSARARAQFLIFGASIEVAPEDLAAFETIHPRILDVLNTYLRAVEESDLERPSAMFKLRAQLLRRIRVISAPAEPKDLLITTFVLK